jgi:hypothetical protein
MKAFFSTLLCITSLSVFAQQKTYDVAISYGAYNSPSFDQNRTKDYFAADFDYHLSKRWTVSSGFMTGRFNYYDNTRSNAPTAILYTNDNTNARGYELHGYAMAKYSVVNTSQFTLQIGIGAGFFNQRLQYPFRDDSGAGAIYLTNSSFTDLEFPVSLEAYYLLGSRVGIGVRAGGYIEPDFPIVGTHVGPQIRVRL